VNQSAPRRRGRKPIADDDRRTMQIRLSIDERSLVLEGLRHMHDIIWSKGDDMHKIDTLFSRVMALK